MLFSEAIATCDMAVALAGAAEFIDNATQHVSTNLKSSNTAFNEAGQASSFLEGGA